MCVCVCACVALISAHRGEDSRQCTLLVQRGLVIAIHQPVQTGLVVIFTLFLGRSNPYTQHPPWEHDPPNFKPERTEVYFQNVRLVLYSLNFFNWAFFFFFIWVAHPETSQVNTLACVRVCVSGCARPPPPSKKTKQKKQYTTWRQQKVCSLTHK